jgi:lipopolysaccharide transport system ATP-binding protein
MTPDIAIRAEELGKTYSIGHRKERQRDRNLRDVFASNLINFRRGISDMARGRPIIVGDDVEEFAALTDVSFEVKRGEALGIIGKNGAGKSTLLKVLSRITELSAGRVEIRGRVASLLEIGTGFHAELTGRENIFLNGVILGMSRAEVRRKFDEIVAFAEVEKFLDTPVKRYSSGMYVRLAFAVAAHLEPEILIVDEVLAVGDAEFQNKCLGKMQDVAGHGRTVLFVSHNMAAIEAICTRALLFDGGRIICQGLVESVTSEYTSRSELAYLMSFAPDSKSPSICRISVNAEALEFRNLIVDVEFVSPWPLQTAVGGLLLKTVMGEPVWGSNCRFHPYESQIKSSARGVLRCQSRGLPITPGQYVLSVWLGDRHERYDSKLDVLKISIAEDRINPLRPPASGHLDWPAVWEGQC